MKRITPVLVCLLLLLPLQARALNTNDLLSLVEMPLAVAAVSNLTGISQTDLANVLANLNQANVPPTQFVQVVRYVPVALAQQPVPFEQFVQTQTSQGVTGPALVTAIDNNLATNYAITPVVQPDQVVYVDDNYVPQSVLSQLAGSDPLAVALMPLAVAEVSQLTNVPQDQLANLVATLNQANVPPTQFVQVVQYAPVALTAQNPPQPFVPFVRTQVSQGVTGPALVATIDQQLPQYGVTPQQVAQPAERVERNPHGGPPGQIKRIEGLQTGAEVVHGEKPGRQFGVAPQRVVIAQPPEHVEHIERPEHEHGNPHGMPPGQARRMVAPPPMTSAAPPVAMPAPPPQGRPGPPAGVPPGQAKRGGDDEGHGNGQGHGHGKD